MSNQPEYDIYILDDDKNYLFLYEQLFKSKKLTVKTFTSADDLLVALKQSPPKVLILDMMMPDMNGDQVIIRISEQKLINLFVPIMITSIEMDDEARFGYATLGIDLILPKNVKNTELLDVVDRKIKEWESYCA